jgi:hypothetical protein
MDQHEKEIIDDVFKKIEAVRLRSDDRDFEADDFIRSRLAEQPDAAYYMVQTIVMQEVALHLAHDRLEGREQIAPRPPKGPAGILGSVGNKVARMLGFARWRKTLGLAAGARPGFISGAVETAIGVAGGVALGEIISGALGAGGPISDDSADAETEFGGPDGVGSEADGLYDEAAFDDDDI